VLETDDSDVTVTEELLREWVKAKGKKAPALHVARHVMILSESSFRGTEDVRRAFEAGADGVLIGTAVMKAQDMEAFLWELIQVGAGDDEG